MKKTLLFLIIFFFSILLPAPAQQNGDIALNVTMGTVETTGVRVDKLIYYSDGLKVKAWVFVPPLSGANSLPASEVLLAAGIFSPPISGADKIPVIVYNHDGVYGLSEETIKLCKDMAARSNYLIVAPTYRGEDGSEGKIEVAVGEVNDVLNVMKAISCYDMADTKRIALFGTSHGALISVKAAAGDKNNQIKCIVVAYGVMDIFTWWEYLTRDGHRVNDSLSRRLYGDGPEDRPEAFHKRMGITKVPYIKCPFLVVHGALDDIVPVNQSYSLAGELAKNNKNYELLIYPNSGHGFLVYAPYAEDDRVYYKKEQKEAKEALEYIFYFIGKYI